MNIEDALYNDNYWVTKNGDILKINDMDNSHLKNAMKYLEKNDFKINIQEKKYNDNGDITFFIEFYRINAKEKYNNMKKVLEDKK